MPFQALLEELERAFRKAVKLDSPRPIRHDQKGRAGSGPGNAPRMSSNGRTHKG
jgi:hypothetical protein